jgi:hypothetical protein
MRSFCIVVQRGHEDLYDALRQAFRSRPGFHVIVDRRRTARGAPRLRPFRDRRGSDEQWGTAHFVIAESLEPFGSN